MAICHSISCHALLSLDQFMFLWANIKIQAAGLISSSITICFNSEGDCGGGGGIPGCRNGALPTSCTYE